MKIILSTLILLAISTVANCQKNQFKENTLTEILCLVENPYEFLGKTDAEVLAAGRPASMRGGAEWKITYQDRYRKNSPNKTRTIIIGTGHGALMFTMTDSTRVIKVIMFLAHADAAITADDLTQLFKDKYTLDNNGNTFITTNSKKVFGLTIGQGGGITIADMSGYINFVPKQ